MEWSLAGAAMQRQSGNNHAEVAEVIAEMNCILDDPRFSSSSRCAKLLRFLVENALAEDSQLIKERTLGIKVFGRSPDYDTNADPVVRMAATEVRKRLAAHYQGSQHGGSVAIRLNPGGYLLTFEPRREEVKPAATTFDPVVDSPEDTSPGAHREAHSSVPGPALPSDIAVNSRRLLGFWRVWWIALLLALVMTGITFTTVSVWNRGYLSTLSSDFPRYAFWKPLLQSPEPIFLCVSDERLLSSGETSASFEELVGFVDVNSAHKITLALRGFGNHTILHLASFLNFKNIAYQPVVFVGGLNNPWSNRMLEGLRYHLRIDSLAKQRWIEDTQHPARRDWSLNDTGQRADFDYGIAARIFDPKTKQWYVVIAGLGSPGTEAACDLLTDTKLTHLIPGGLPANKNVEIVIRTRVIASSPGIPEILTTFVW